MKKPSDIVSFGGFEFDVPRGVLRKDGHEVGLAPLGHDLLRYLVERPGAIVTKEELVQQVWNAASVTDHSVTEAIRGLRQALDDDSRNPRFIQTLHSRGYRFIADVTRVTEESSDDPAVEAPPSSDAEPRTSGVTRRWHPLLWGVVGIAVAAVGVAWLLSARSTTADAILAFPIDLEGEHALLNSQQPSLTVSPDGQTVVFMGCRGSVFSSGCWLYRRPLGQEGIERIPGQRFGGWNPFFSPDGDWVAFWGARGLNKISMTGEPRQLRLAEETALNATASEFMGGTWLEDETIVLAMLGNEGGLWSVPPSGDPVRKVQSPPEIVFKWPERVPGRSDMVLVTLVSSAGAGSNVGVVSLETNDVKVIVQNATFPRLLDSGHLLFMRDGRLFAVAFDSQTLEASGEYIDLELEFEPHVEFPGDSAQFAVSASGTVVLAPQSGRRLRRLLAVDRDGETQPVPTRSINPQSASVSPDGSKIMIGAGVGQELDLYARDARLPGTELRRTTGEWNRSPVWSPNGNSVVYGHRIDGDYYGLSRMDLPDDQGVPLLGYEDSHLGPQAWSGEDQLIYMRQRGGVLSRDRDLWVLDLSGMGESPLLTTPHLEDHATLSPDDRWFAYHSDENTSNGSTEVFVRPFPVDLAQHDPSGKSPRWKVPTDCAGWPAWSPDGKEIYFRCSQTLWSVPIDADHATMTVDWGIPRQIFRPNDGAKFFDRGPGPIYSFYPDGRLLIIIEDKPQEINRLHALSGFATFVRNRVGESR